jgi:hypothetical protein
MDSTVLDSTTATVEYRIVTPTDFENLMKFEFPAGTDMTRTDGDIVATRYRR